MKARLRTRILARRNEMPLRRRKELNQRIAKRMYGLSELKDVKSILFYVSFGSEVDTHQMIRQFLKTNKKTVLVPLVKKNDPALHVSKLVDFNDLQKGSFNILEPKKSKIKKFNANKIDAVLVPGTVFDKKGHRIGYGFGYYDRFLKILPKKIKKIGLAFDFQLVDKIQHEKHDVPVDLVVSEKRILRMH